MISDSFIFSFSFKSIFRLINSFRFSISNTITTIMATRYIAYIWKYSTSSHGMLSRENESLKDFKNRCESIYPTDNGWHHQFSEFKEIW